MEDRKVMKKDYTIAVAGTGSKFSTTATASETLLMWMTLSRVLSV